MTITDLVHRIPEADPLMNDPEQVRVYSARDTEEPFREFIALFQRIFTPGPITGKVLDIGCGQGEVTFPFASAFPHCHIEGIDAAERMIDLARCRAVAGAVLNARFSRARLPDDSPPSLNYDAVISNSLLHHLADGGILWRAIRQFARRGAPVLVMDLIRPESREDAMRLVDQFGSGLHEIVRRDFFHSLQAAFRPVEVRSQLDAAGLSGFRLESISELQMIVYGSNPG